MSDGIALRVMSYAMLGIVLAGAYLFALRWNIQLYLEQAHIWKPLLVHLLRLAGAVAVLAACARAGALPLLSGFGGFVAMRTVLLHQFDCCFQIGCRWGV